MSKDVTDALGKRMKSFYEERSRVSLLRRVPVIIRVDGKSFHTFCKRFEKPYSPILNEMLNNVMVYLCSKIQGAKFAERHSDEISILVTDYDTLTTDAFFDYQVQKICSITASMAATEFCKQLITAPCLFETYKRTSLLYTDETWPTFDSRCFNIPFAEIVNYFWWRNIDCVRGSINMFAQSQFSHKQLQNKHCDEMKDMLINEKGINWNNLPQEQKTGFICIKETINKEVDKGPNKGKMFSRNVWKVSAAPKTQIELHKVIYSIEGV
jgi:tRNA(His) guanylyltransferase